MPSSTSRACSRRFCRRRRTTGCNFCSRRKSPTSTATSSPSFASTKRCSASRGGSTLSASSPTSTSTRSRSTLLYDKLEQWALPLNERRDEDTFLQAVLVYHVLGEGVIARTGQNLAAARYQALQGFPGLVEGNGSSRGTRLVTSASASPTCAGAWRMTRSARVRSSRSVIEDAVAVAGEMLETANDGMADLVASGYGVDPAGFYAEVMRLVHIRLRSIGFSEA